MKAYSCKAQIGGRSESEVKLVGMKKRKRKQMKKDKLGKGAAKLSNTFVVGDKNYSYWLPD